MRKIVAAVFVSLDGVMQAPGGPQEDPSGGFEHGGWVFHWFDEQVGPAVDEGFAQGIDLLLGRTTYDIFASHWPHVVTDPQAEGYDEGSARIAEAFDRVTKYVATHTPATLGWKNTEWLGEDVVARLRELKKQDGPMLLIQGSSRLIQQLLAADLIDEFRLLVFPLLLGRGKRLFGDGAMPGTLRLTRSSTSRNGVLILNYERAGDLQTGSFARAEPSEAELERRQRME